MKRYLRRRTLLAGAAAAALTPGRAARAADVPLDLLDPYAKPGPHLDDLVRSVLLDATGAKQTMSRLWSAWQDRDDERYAEWALAYGFVWWRREPDRKKRMQIATIGQRMAAGLLDKRPDSVVGLSWQAAYMGFWALSRGVMESLHVVPKLIAIAEQANAVDPTYMYGLSNQLLGRVHFKAPPFPVSRGNPQKSLMYLEKARPYAEGKFGPWYLFLAESLHINGRKAEAKQLMASWESQIQPTNLIELFNVGLTRIDFANLQQALADGSYDRYLWDAYLVPVTNEQILATYHYVRRKYLRG